MIVFPSAARVLVVAKVTSENVPLAGFGGLAVAAAAATPTASPTIASIRTNPRMALLSSVPPTERLGVRRRFSSAPAAQSSATGSSAAAPHRPPEWAILDSNQGPPPYQ